MRAKEGTIPGSGAVCRVHSRVGELGLNTTSGSRLWIDRFGWGRFRIGSFGLGFSGGESLNAECEDSGAGDPTGARDQ